MCRTLYICCPTNDLPMKEEKLNLRIDKELKKKLQAQAKKENRTLSNYVITVLQNAVSAEKK